MALSQGPSGARALVANVGLRLDSHKVVGTVEAAFRGLVVTYFPHQFNKVMDFFNLKDDANSE